MEIKVFKQQLFDKALSYGFSDCELYYISDNGFSVSIFEGQISEYKNSVSKGLSFRGTYNGKMGYAYTELIDESVIDFLISNAAENSKIIEDKEIEKLYKGDSEYPDTNSFNPELEKVSAEEKINKLTQLEKTVYSLDERVKSVDYCGLGTGHSEVYIANTLGLDQSNKMNMAMMYAFPRVSENGSVKLAGEEMYATDFNALDINAVSKKAVDLAVSYLGASTAPSGNYKVLLTNSAFTLLFGTFSRNFYAENAQKGFSLLKDKQGTEVASKSLTIRDDGVCGLSIASVPFDSEGVATKCKTVIENGVLKTLLYNLKSAEKDKVASTGNGFKPGFREPVTTNYTNFYVVPGSDVTHEDLIAEMENGLIISSLEGTHSGANPISGDFSLSAQGHLVENGKIIRAVDQITIAGNFYQVLKDITGIGNDIKFEYTGIGAIGSPSVLVKQLSVSGS